MIQSPPPRIIVPQPAQGTELSSRVIECPFETPAHTSNSGSRPGELRFSRAITYRICFLHPLPSVLPLSPPSLTHPLTIPPSISAGAQHAQTPMTLNIVPYQTLRPIAQPHILANHRTTSHFISQHDAHPDTIPAVYRKIPESNASALQAVSPPPRPFRVDVREGSSRWRKFD